MKKLFAIVALIATLFVTEKAQAQLSINLGYAPETFTTSYGNHSTTANYQGFYGGFTYSIVLMENLDVSVGLQFRMNTNSETSTLIVTTKKTDSQYLLDVPVLLNYDISLNKDISIIPFVGPMLSYAVAGATKTTIGNTTSTVKWYGENSMLNTFNLNIVGGVAFAYDDFMLHAGYRIGLIDQDKSDNLTTKTKGFFVGLGYEF